MTELFPEGQGAATVEPPQCDLRGATVDLTAANITALATNFQGMTTREEWCTCAQEVAVRAADIPMYEALAAEAGRTAKIGNPDPSAKKAAAGVAVFVAGRDTATRLKTMGINADLDLARTAGRLDVFAVKMPCGTVLTIYNVYLWQGSETCMARRAKGNRVLAAVLKDAARRGGPCALVGDFNAHPTTYPALAAAFSPGGGWTDLGANDWANTPRNTPTCFANEGSKGTRVDAILVNNHLSRGELQSWKARRVPCASNSHCNAEVRRVPRPCPGAEDFEGRCRPNSHR